MEKVIYNLEAKDFDICVCVRVGCDKKTKLDYIINIWFSYTDGNSALMKFLMDPFAKNVKRSHISDYGRTSISSINREILIRCEK